LSCNELPSDSITPVLYSFRRCPYAMRARMAIYYAGVTVELREVLLRDKPAEMLRHSAKGTVPVLALPDGAVIDESMDIMTWALMQNDRNNWLPKPDDKAMTEVQALISENDGSFKAHLDYYKYADRYPAYSKQHYRMQGEVFLSRLERRLANMPYLVAERVTVADIAVFPFIRQFAFVDETWFFSSPYQQLQKWLNQLLNTDLFLSVMRKYPVWKAGNDITLIP